MTAAIKVSNVSVAFGTFMALDSVSLEVPAGSCYAIVGESGSGKSTLMRAILGLQPFFHGSIEVNAVNVDQTSAGLRRRARTIQPLFQDPMSSLSPRLRIRSLFSEAGGLAGLSPSQSLEKMQELFARVALPMVVADRYPHQISGGQARRVAVCRALMMAPKILVADEPTAGLDLSAQGDLMNLLQDLREEFGLTLLVVTHQLAVARLVSDETGVLHLGRLVEAGPTERVFDQPSHDYTKRLLEAQ
jgi:peptide/nickel transport system ATP-binding protein